MLPPYNTVHKFAAIVLDDVERVVIGDSSLNTTVSENVFEKSRFGIFSNRSSLELFNNSFKDMEAYDEPVPNGLTLHWPKLTYSSIGIYNLSDFDFNDRKITIGEDINFSGSDTRNSFSNINYGIYSQNESNVKIRLNDFGIGNEDFDNGSVGISINNPGNKTIDISNRNEFKSYTYGIFVNQLSRGTSLSVNNNKFYYGWTNNSTYTGTGIFISHLTGVRPEIVSLTGNEFGGTQNSNFQFPRIAIRAANIVGVEIDDNLIQYDFTDPPGFNYSGIWTTNCYGAKIRSNTITNIATPNDISLFNDLLVGVRVENCHLTCIESQELINLGMGMHFTSNSIVGSLFNNTMNNFDEGIHLANADIGSVQGGPWVSGSFNDLANEWIQPNGANVNSRITGVRNIPLPINWWHSAANTTDPKFPGSTGGLVNAIPISGLTYSVSQCTEKVENDPPMDMNARNANFGAVAADTARYNTEYWETSKYQSEMVLFATLKKYPELLDFNDSSDIVFQEFYEYYSGSNLEKAVDVMNLFTQGNYGEAGTVLSSIADTLNWEINFKGVIDRCINMVTGEKVFDESDSLYLDSIANLNVYEGGLPVLMARNALKLEIYDTQGGGSRIADIIKNSTSHGSLVMVPNPANQEVTIMLPPEVELYNVNLYDQTGRIMMSELHRNSLNLFALLPGIYVVEASTSVGIKVNKLVVIR